LARILYHRGTVAAVAWATVADRNGTVAQALGTVATLPADVLAWADRLPP
jgi:hypothetical protein